MTVHGIEDLDLNGIRLAYQGGGGLADAALEPPEKTTRPWNRLRKKRVCAAAADGFSAAQ